MLPLSVYHLKQMRERSTAKVREFAGTSAACVFSIFVRAGIVQVFTIAINAHQAPMRTLVNFWVALLRYFLALFRNRQDQAIVELALRQATRGVRP